MKRETDKESLDFRDKISSIVLKIMGVPKQRRSTLPQPQKVDSQTAKILRTMKKNYYDLMAETKTRKDMYDRFEYLDKNLAEATAALNIYADNIVSGSIGGAENYKVVIEEEVKNFEALEKLVETAEKKTEIKDAVWDIARDMIRDGDLWQELIIEGEGTNFFIAQVKPLPTKEIYADVDDRGIFFDPKKPYFQKSDSSVEKDTVFEDWRIIHFKMGRDVYGANRSMFNNASQRIGRQLLWIDESLVLARITRAWMRYAFIVDTTGLVDDQKWDYVELFRDRLKRKEVVQQGTGQIDILDAPWMPDEDIVLPVTKDGKTDVKQLTGDLNLGNIDDIRYIQTKFLMVLSIPKAYASLEEGTRAKATLNQIDVQFARQVRRRQRALLPGLRKFYRTVFILGGADPTTFKWDVVFPELATSDELMLWEMTKLKAEVAKILVVEVGALNNAWILRELLGMGDDEIEKYGTELTKDDGAPPEERFRIPPETWALMRRDPEIRQLVDDLKDIVASKEERQKALEGMQTVGM